MPTEAELNVHRSWIGTLQPVGLVVSPPALANAQAFPDKNIIAQQKELIALCQAGGLQSSRRDLAIRDFPAFARQVLGWKAKKLAGGPDGPSLPDTLAVVLPEFNETLRPTYAVPALAEDGGEWMMLVQVLEPGVDLDATPDDDDRRWHASPQVRFERLLRENGVAIGFLCNGKELRLVYAPRGESSGHMTWPVYALCEVMGRPLLSALCMLLGSTRLFTLAKDQRLPHILKESRKYQNFVSITLAGQVLEALNELLRGFQAANDATRGQLLDDTVRDDPNHVYGGLLAVILRLVFVLYAEERGMLSSASVYVRSYSLTGLFEKLRADAGRFPDTMDQRYGAWSRLIVLFRMIHDGAPSGNFNLPSRQGHLFDPDSWPFLEGRPRAGTRDKGSRIRLDVPKVSDGVVYRVLHKLLLLDGDRLSYRALDVEQIGSVYEGMMGFRLERALETSIGVGKQHVVIGLETLLSKRGADREKRLKEEANVELSGKTLKALKEAATVEALVAALSRRISPLTPRPIPAMGLYLQPTDERRRSGSHYTPRDLTAPIVETALRPVLEDLGPTPAPEQILALKVCDPAMGSGAFLVEACRQLAQALVRSYDVHGRPSDVPPDEDLVLYAQRKVAQGCLYGVDKNPFAVDLGKLSLWLATLAKDHPFTFLDHSIRHGDSLVGLSRDQIESFHWEQKVQIPTLGTLTSTALKKAAALRREIQSLSASNDVDRKRRLLKEADDALDDVRLVGDCVIASFFSEHKPKAREAARTRAEEAVRNWLSIRTDAADLHGLSAGLRECERAVPAFHWEIEFPEVFGRKNPGFDAIVGNPPFLGGTLIGGRLGLEYHDCLIDFYLPATGLSDIVAFFLRRAFKLLRAEGTFGLIGTNTVAQGDTRNTGLEQIVRQGGVIYRAQRRYKWPGEAAVIVSIVHVAKTRRPLEAILDDKSVERISAYLLKGTVDSSPALLSANKGKSYLGTKIWGAGFRFEDEPKEGASSLEDMNAIIAREPQSREVIFSYMGGEELNASPTQSACRFVIDFGDMSEAEARRWPSLFSIVEERIRPIRAGNKQRNYREEWWLHANRVREAAPYVREHGRMLALTSVSKNVSVAFAGPGTVMANTVILILLHEDADFSIIQSRVHEIWARLVGSSMKDDLRYTTPCFDTFPRPLGSNREAMDRAGKTYCEFRAALMIRNDEGLTKTYNRFHDPDETDADILKLRELHDEMDRAVLDAYGWSDVQPTCEFILDYEEDEDDDEVASGKRRKKKPWRYRWPDEVRDEVLARLLELNAQRAKEEAASAGNGAGTGKKKERAGRKKKAEPAGQGGLF